MFDSALFDEVGCEEYYNEDIADFVEELRLDEVNGELQIVAEETREDEIFVEWSEMIMARCWSSEFEASHVEP